MFGQDLHEDLDNYFDVVSAMHYELYDFIFNDARKGTLLGNGFIGWLETEENVPHSQKLEEPLTVALIQEFAADFCIVEDVDIVEYID
jgi:hypothetical protein